MSICNPVVFDLPSVHPSKPGIVVSSPFFLPHLLPISAHVPFLPAKQVTGNLSESQELLRLTFVSKNFLVCLYSPIKTLLKHYLIITWGTHIPLSVF